MSASSPGPTDSALAPGPGAPCDVCGGPTVERHCKVICIRCGHIRDCSDP